MFNKEGLYVGGVDLKLYMKTDDMLAFEFTIETELDIYDDEEVLADYFRLEQHSNGMVVYIYTANSEDYYIYDEATNLFDVEFIFAELQKQFINKNVPDITENFLKFLEEEESA